MAAVAKKLHSLYYNDKQGYLSKKRFHTLASKNIPKLTRADFDKFWDSELVTTTSQQARKKFARPIYISPNYGRYLGADLAEFKALKYKSFKFALIVQDIHSRKLLGLVAQKTKTARETGDNFIKILNKFPQLEVKKVNTDQGREREEGGGKVFICCCLFVRRRV